MKPDLESLQNIYNNLKNYKCRKKLSYKLLNFNLIYIVALSDIIYNRPNKSYIFSCENIFKTKAYKNSNEKISQIDFYKNNGSHKEWIDNIVSLENKKFGSKIESMVKELLNINKPLSTKHDGIFKNKKIEIKSARYWINNNNKLDCVWQHIELDDDYDYDYILFILVDFTELKLFIISKEDLISLKKDKKGKILTKQGKQGYMCKKSIIEPFLKKINNLDDFIDFIN